MFGFIPVEYYTAVYYNILLCVVLITLFRLYVMQKRIAYSNTGSFLLLTFIVLYMGLRPINGNFFGDMGDYATTFIRYSNGDYSYLTVGDILYNYYVKVCSSIMQVRSWFLLTAFIYVGSMYWACKRIFLNYAFIAFLVCVTAFSFWSYGTNGIRNGMATSLFLLSLSFFEQKKNFFASTLVGILLCLLAMGIHKSIMLPFLAALLAIFYTNTRHYIYFWMISIVLSLLAGRFWENFFGSLGFDERTSYFTNTENADLFSSTGFRWDFLLYSMVPIILGWYVVVKRKMQDKLYLLLLNTYIISNAFWILVIRASYSNRFAYLSWFLYPIVLIYPLLKFNLWKRQNVKMSVVVFLHFLFTYVMWLIK